MEGVGEGAEDGTRVGIGVRSPSSSFAGPSSVLISRGPSIIL